MGRRIDTGLTMPAFRIIPSVSPATYVELPARVWADPASSTRASRITTVNDRQNRFYRVAPGTLVRLAAILDSSNVFQNDTVQKFTAWPLEYASAYPPIKSYPIASTSSVVEFLLDVVGHYTLAMRGESEGADPAKAIGAVFIHIDVTER